MVGGASNLTVDDPKRCISKLDLDFFQVAGFFG